MATAASSLSDRAQTASGGLVKLAILRDCSPLPRPLQNETLRGGARVMIGLARRVRVAWSVSCLCLTAAVFEASLFHADVVQAQPSGTERETARALVGEGDRLFAAKDYANALARYSSAYRLVRAPTVGIEVAKAQAALGRLIEANTTLIDI